MSRYEIGAIALALLATVGTAGAAFAYEWSRHRAPDGAPRTVTLVARQEGWSQPAVAVQPGERLRLRVTSADVTHGLAIPELGVQLDHVAPGKFTTVEVTVPASGTLPFYPAYCTIPCGERHDQMKARVVVTGGQGAGTAMATGVPDAGEAARAARPPAAQPAPAPPATMPSSPEQLATGKVVFQESCANCHGARADGLSGKGANLLEKQPGPEKVRQMVREGSADRQMKPFTRRQISDAEVEAVIGYLVSIGAARPSE